MLALAVAGLPALACSSSKEPAPSASPSATVPASPSPQAAATAGRVVDVGGVVTVAGKQLLRGDTVQAGDLVETGADGSVAIELAHNLARWELGPNKRLRVSDSIAWREPMRTAAPTLVEQDTASAGRHAERAASDTVATAVDRTDAKNERAGTGKKVDKNFDKQIEKGLLLGEGTAIGGGLGLKGTGPGGGGTGGGIGIGSIGTNGKLGGTGQGYGAGNGRLGGSHKTKAATVRPGSAEVSGSLPAEVIQRIMRASAPRFRFCYQKALQADPTLAGRITVRFVIDRSGAVPSAKDAGSTLASPEVVSCVLSVITTLSFPAPEGGIVTVTYPFMFAPGE